MINLERNFGILEVSLENHIGGVVPVRGVAIVLLIIMTGFASAGGVYTGSDGQQVALGNLPKIAVVEGHITEGDLNAVLEANFKAGGKIVSNSKKIGLPTLSEFEKLVESLSAGAEGKALAEIAKIEAQKKGWPVKIGKKDGDYYSVAVVSHNGNAVAAEIICIPQVMLTSTGPDKSMIIE